MKRSGVAVLTNSLALSLALMTYQVSAQEVLAGSKYDEYTKATGIATQNYVLPGEDIGSSFSHSKTAYALLMANVTDAGQESITLRVVYTDFNGWAFLAVAHDSDGGVLPVKVVSRDVESGSRVKEEISVDLARGYLVSHLETGLNIRVDGKDGQIVVKLPPKYVAAFMKQLELSEASARKKMTSISAVPGKPKLGVGFLPVDKANAPLMGLSSPKGIIVARVDPDSLASKAGFKVGDVIFSANGKPIPGTLTGLPEILAGFPAGAAVDFTIWRSAAEDHVTVQF
jgi:hypothetical protein